MGRHLELPLFRSPESFLFSSPLSFTGKCILVLQTKIIDGLQDRAMSIIIGEDCIDGRIPFGWRGVSIRIFLRGNERDHNCRQTPLLKATYYHNCIPTIEKDAGKVGKGWNLVHGEVSMGVIRWRMPMNERKVTNTDPPGGST